MRTLALTCKDPELWLNDYAVNGMLKLEFFTCLTGCATSANPEAIIRCVPPGLKEEYREYISGVAKFEDEEDLIFINGPRIFGLKEARVLDEWLALHSEEKKLVGEDGSLAARQ